MDFNIDNEGKSLLYVDGCFSDIEYDDEPLKLIGESSEHNVWDRLLKRSGYDIIPTLTFGKRDGCFVEFYRATVEGLKAPYRYLVVIMMDGRKQLVYIHQYHHLLRFLGELAPIASTAKKFVQSDGKVTYSSRVY